MDIYNLENKLGQLKERLGTKLTKTNFDTVLEFINYCSSNRNNTVSRLIRHLEDFEIVSRLEVAKKDFGEFTTKDVETLVSDLNKLNKIRVHEGEPYSEHTKLGVRITLKKFFWWLRGCQTEGTRKVYPQEVNWISTKLKIRDEKLPEDILTEEEVKKLITTATNPRDKALIAILYETGTRIAELLTIKIKSITFHNVGASILVGGKTGQRRLLIVPSTSYLRDWINKHPDKYNPDALVWIKSDCGQLGYQRVRLIIQRIANKAGIKKRVNPHNFRHTRATILSKHFSDAEMKSYFGWTQSSKMASIYVHLSGKDIDETYKRIYGIQDTEQVTQNPLKPITCIRCQEINPPTNTYCYKCGQSLNLQRDIETSKLTMDEIVDKIIDMEKLLEELEKEHKKKLNGG